MLTAFVLVDVEPARIAAVAAELADLPGVTEAYSVTGEADVVAVVRVREHEDLADVVTGGIATVGGVTGTRTLIAFRAYSRHDLDSMWSLGSE